MLFILLVFYIILCLSGTGWTWLQAFVNMAINLDFVKRRQQEHWLPR